MHHYIFSGWTCRYFFICSVIFSFVFDLLCGVSNGNQGNESFMIDMRIMSLSVTTNKSCAPISYMHYTSTNMESQSVNTLHRQCNALKVDVNLHLNNASWCTETTFVIQPIIFWVVHSLNISKAFTYSHTGMRILCIENGSL